MAAGSVGPTESSKAHKNHVGREACLARSAAERVIPCGHRAGLGCHALILATTPSAFAFAGPISRTRLGFVQTDIPLDSHARPYIGFGVVPWCWQRRRAVSVRWSGNRAPDQDSCMLTHRQARMLAPTLYFGAGPSIGVPDDSLSRPPPRGAEEGGDHHQRADHRDRLQQHPSFLLRSDLSGARVSRATGRGDLPPKQFRSPAHAAKLQATFAKCFASPVRGVTRRTRGSSILRQCGTRREAPPRRR